MKILIVTQAVDKKDSNLGFFHRWVEEFAKHCESVLVLCLRSGEFDLPPNVKVVSLGKIEKNGGGFGSRIVSSLKFLRYIREMRRQYDCVFVHMNQEYVLLGGLFWKMWGKKIALWYVHKSVNFKLRFTIMLCDYIFTATKESFRLESKKVHIVGHGIDTDFFTPDLSVSRGSHLLSVGRLMKSKRHDLAIEASVLSNREIFIAGEGSEKENLEKLAKKSGARVKFLGGLTQEGLRDEYRRAACFIHTSETGSLDKVVLEAISCGCPVITIASWMSKYIPVSVAKPDARSIADAISSADLEKAGGAQIIKEKFSLGALIPKILLTMKAH